MKTSARHNTQKYQGSAMILVVVLTVLLAVVGVMFMMTSRINDMSSAAVVDNRDLEAGVQTVVGRINTILTQDLFGTDLKKAMLDNADPNINEPYDSPGAADRWLANIEPDENKIIASGGVLFEWQRLSDLSKSGVAPLWNRQAAIVPEYPKYNFPANTEPNMNGLIADADGDGVADAMWIRLNDMCTSKGKPIFAAVRIIDNCAMLNLNTAYGACPSAMDFGKYLSSVDFKSFLRAYDKDLLKRIQIARDRTELVMAVGCKDYHDKVVMKIENPNEGIGFMIYSLFGIEDELEIRNRYLLTSKTVARFEKRDPQEELNKIAIPPQYKGVAYQTFDLGKGDFGYDNWAGYFKSRVASTPFTAADFEQWKKKLNVFLFDHNPDNPAVPDYEYDRRHICTFYSVDRNLRKGDYAFLAGKDDAVKRYFRPDQYCPIDLSKIRFNNSIDSRRQVVQLLYGFRESYRLKGLSVANAAQKSAQLVANIIDYADDNTDAGGVLGNPDYGSQKNLNMTYINKAIVDKLLLEVTGNNAAIAGDPALQFGLSATETIYGFERQPFISEVYCQWDGAAGGSRVFAVELLNPYTDQISLENWRLVVGGTTYPLDNTFVVPAAASQTQPGFLTVYAAAAGYANPPIAAGTQKNINGFGLGTGILTNKVIRIQRPEPTDPANVFITADEYTPSQITNLSVDGLRILKRDTSGWKFANNLAVAPVDSAPRLGQDNNVSVSRKGYPLPVTNVNSGFGILNDFIRVALVSNANASAADPNCITAKIAAASDESAVRLDVVKDAGLLNGLCFMSRTQGTLPGRININTAPRHVIAAAIPSMIVHPGAVVGGALPVLAPGDPNTREYLAAEIVKNRPYTKLSDLLKISDMVKYYTGGSSASVNLGDPSIDNDIEERDWILSRLSNIFTVRSDTFTAYVLVRLGVDGPQRRMIAIFDRSNVWSPQDKPKLVALHPVPDPR